MADALVSPAVGATLWAASGGAIALSARKIRHSPDNDLIPMMGVLGAFVFAAQMINFAIPGTGSSGHLGGGLMLAILLGPWAAFLAIASVLTVQAFFFADGGLLALGCNIFNLGFFPAFLAYPLIYLPIAGKERGTTRAWIAAIAAATAGLQLGALGVVIETRASGISNLPFSAFTLLMLPIHLAIGLVEGLATAAVVSFVAKARPETFPARQNASAASSLKPVWFALATAALIMAGAISWFASADPDGLEWSIAKATGKEGGAATIETSLHKNLADVQAKTVILPSYAFKAPETHAEPIEKSAPEPWPAVSAGTSVSGIVGGLMSLALAALIALALKAGAARRARGSDAASANPHGGNGLA